MSNSPPCFAHELVEHDDGSFSVADKQQTLDVMRWRKSERHRLIADRLSLPYGRRNGMDKAIIAHLNSVLGETDGLTISFYWPFRAEPDLRPAIGEMQSRGATCALPVVTERNAPLTFRRWHPGDRLERGVWNIPVPADGEEVRPDIVIAPVVGFDPGCYRLGYGGGFFDRTLATMHPRPRCYGVGYGFQAIATIFPQHHDIPMDAIATESHVVWPDRNSR